MIKSNLDELDALIIRNLGEMEGAAHRLHYNIQGQIEKEMNIIAEAWATQNMWNGAFECLELNLWVAPPAWSKSETRSMEWSGRFIFGAGAGDDFAENATEDFFWLTRLCRKGRGRLGFRFHYNPSYIGTTRAKWKRLVQSENSTWIQNIGKYGFEYEETGFFFMPVRVEAEDLATAILEGTLPLALEPLRAALNRLAGAKPVFDQLLAAAK